MAKTLRTSGDYTIKTGTGAGGSNYINFDSSNTRVMGNLIVDGTRTELNTSTLSVEDSSLLLNRNASGADIDSGLMIERDGSNNAAFYWNEGDDVWRAVLTSSGPTSTTIADTALAKIQVAEPSANSDVATKNYVDTSVGGAQAIQVTGDDSTVLSISGSNKTLRIAGGENISSVTTSTPETITLNLNHDLTAITSVTSDTSNGDLTLVTSGTGDVVINDTLTFSAAASDPTATTVTKIYNKTVSGGGTGLFFINSAVNSGTAGELISKSKATALAIALG